MKPFFLLLIIFFTSSLASAQEFTKYHVSKSSAESALETKSSAESTLETNDFTQLKSGEDLKLVLPADTVERLERLRSGQLTAEDKLRIQESLVTALGIPLPTRPCTVEVEEKCCVRTRLN